MTTPELQIMLQQVHNVAVSAVTVHLACMKKSTAFMGKSGCSIFVNTETFFVEKWTTALSDETKQYKPP